MADSNITKEFLEEALGKEIESFEVNSGSNIGDGYSSLLFRVEVNLKTANGTAKPENSKTEKETGSESEPEPTVLHLLLKCYPVNPVRQIFLTEANVFEKELRVYDTFIPELVRFQLENNTSTNSKKPKFYPPPFPKFYHGNAVDYTNLAEGESKVCTNPLDNYLLMTDLRRNGDFKLANRLTGFDYDHAKLVIENQAKLHALSWAYKIKTDTPSLASKYPFLSTSMFDGMDENLMDQMTGHNLGLFEGVVKNDKSLSEGKKQEFLDSIKRFKGINNDVSKIYISAKPPKDEKLNKDNLLRVPQPHIENEEPWLVLTHGDSWLNNMMFRYDETTGKPLEVLFVDLQITREGDPFADVAYNFYTSTGADLRREHLDDLLKLYHDSFLEVCEDFGVPPLPGFDLSEVQRRFHRAKAFGFSMSIMGLPLFLNEQKNIPDMEAMEGENMDDMMEKFLDMSSKVTDNSAFADRVLGLVSEFHAQGVI